MLKTNAILKDLRFKESINYEQNTLQYLIIARSEFSIFYKFQPL